ncbi:MAG: SCO family protein [Hyphomonas sp.]|nr:SCO family protein [Hyphomonas sp.]
MRTQLSLAVLALLAGACSPPASQEAAAPAAAAKSGGAQSSCLSRAYPEIGGPISLVSSTGARVTEADFKGRPTLIYFGFTYCPDVCPMTLTSVAAAYRKLPEGVTPPQTLLISVDPARDTPEALATYVANKAFPAGLIGLTGTEEEIRAAADAFKADYSRVDQPDSMAEYTMDHTSLLYLMDENWQLKTFFTHQDTADTIAECLTTIAAE